MVMDKYLAHQNLINETTLYLQKKFPEARFFERHVGKFLLTRFLYSIKNVGSLSELKRVLFIAKNKFMISINKPGMSDQYMIYPIEINGNKVSLHMELEYKTGKAKLSLDQKRWKSICKKLNVFFVEVRDKEEAYEQIKDYLDGLKK